MRFGLGFLCLALLNSGCSSTGGTAATSAKSKLAPCLTPPREVTTLYTGGVSGIAAVGDDIVIQGDGLVRVALSTGQATPVAMVQDPSGLVALDGTLYFTAEEPAGAPDAQGKQPSEAVFQSVPVDGGAPEPISGVTPGNLAHAVDDDSLYFDALASSSGGSAVMKLTPPSAEPVELALDGSILINAIAVHDGQVYVAGDDFKSSSQTQNGVIERIPKNGGRAERLVSDVGHPFALVADDSGLYWVEDPAGFGPAHVVHAGLDGSSRRELIEASDSSLALAAGRIYFSSDNLESIPTSGGEATTLATDLKSPGMFLVAGGNLVWVDPVTKALSDPTVPRLMTACLSD